MAIELSPLAEAVYRNPHGCPHCLGAEEVIDSVAEADGLDFTCTFHCAYCLLSGSCGHCSDGCFDELGLPDPDKAEEHELEAAKDELADKGFEVDEQGFYYLRK